MQHLASAILKPRPHLALLSWVLLMLVSVNSAQADLKEDITSLFPKQTRIDNRLESVPVYPVYQLNQLLGYAWISTEINDIPGFAGKPIKLLIGLDSEGVFKGVKVLDHHEPVFLHGLGNEALNQFVQQYQGHSVSEQIIVSSGQNRQNNSSTDGPVYFDGVSKATVSVIIINDVVLSTALKVARKTLEGFALASQSILRDKPFSKLSWQEMVNAGLIHQWKLTTDEVTRQLGRSLSDYPNSFSVEANETEAFTELYYAYLNAETVGRNLFGDQWQVIMDTLKPDEHLVWVGSNGLYPHVADNFTPGTVPPRISLNQSGLSIELRDANLPESLTQPILSDKPVLTHAHILRIKGLSGFDLGNEASLNLNISLALNHLVSDKLQLQSNYQLPDSLWEKQDIEDPLEKTTALWLRIWQDKIPQILVLVIALAFLSAVFIKQRRLSLNSQRFHQIRWIYLWFTLLYIGLYAQGQLSVVNIFTLFHSIRDGFELGIFLLDPVIFILWTFTFVTLFIWGRGLFCGWLCPFGALQEILSALGKWLGLRQIRISDTRHRWLIYLKYPILVGLVLLSFYSLTWAEKFAEVEPFKTSITLLFIREWPFVIYAVLLLLIGMFIHKFYCRYLCPLGAGLAILGYFRRFEWLDRIQMCGSPCQTCYNRCEIKAIKKSGDIDYNECIQCLECIVILNDDNQCADKLLKRKNKRVVSIKPLPAT